MVSSHTIGLSGFAKMKWILAACFVAAVLGATPPRPQLPEQFESRVFVDLLIKNGTTNTTIRAEGWWAVDEPEGKALEDYRFPDPEQDIFQLQRYDAGFAIVVEDRDVCTRTAVNGTMAPVWSWVAAATYEGRQKFGGLQVDIWTFSVGYAAVSVGVTTHNANLPVFVVRAGQQQDVLIMFQHFEARKPSELLFVPPRFCPEGRVAAGTWKPNQVGCVARDAIISRAQAWVDAKVPYNQGGYYHGYREDCSGFVSMAWELKSSMTTQTLPQVSHRISKAELKPGDVLLDEAEHVVLFGGWSGGDSHYVAYEETRPGEGTVKRVTPYPYWYNQAAFIPYRFNSAC